MFVVKGTMRGKRGNLDTLNNKHINEGTLIPLTTNI
jgi:hypothetical protein